MKVLITGGSGLIGVELTKQLLDKGIEVTHLSRSKNSKIGVKTYVWDYKKNYLEEGALDGVTHIVHLAGAGIADKPWTMDRKRTIVKSRVLTARLLLTEIKKQHKSIDAFISASGVGYYGAVTKDKVFTEEDDPESDFVAECCIQWENQTAQFTDLTRVAILRTGVVLSKEGGAVERIGSMVKKGIGAALGSGEQYMPWIHIDDIVNMYVFALMDNSVNGIFNAVADEHVTNEQMTKEIGNLYNRKIWLPSAPEFVVKMMFGEMAEILLEGSKVGNDKIKNAGFKFKYNNLKDAMNNL